MRIIKNIFALSAILLLLSSCAGKPPMSESDAVLNMQQRNKDLLNIKNWQLNGQATIKTKDKKQSVNIVWIQNQDKLYMLLSSFGTTYLSVKSDKNNAIATTNKGEKIKAKNAQDLVYKITGFKIPLQKLKLWLFALTHQNDKYSFNEAGDIDKISNNKYQAELSDWTQVDNIPMPMFVRLKSGDLSIVFDIDEWIFNKPKPKTKKRIPLMGI